jgi:5'-nucleotidase
MVHPPTGLPPPLWAALCDLCDNGSIIGDLALGLFTPSSFAACTSARFLRRSTVHFLVTNDDGIGSVFLREFIAALLAEGHSLSVVAPKVEQSWVGAGKSRHRAVHSTPADFRFGCPTWIVDGTPSDCVNIALDHLLKVPVDGVLSGINIGLNVSLGFIIASGTVAGAWEGALHGLPSIAYSQEMTPACFEYLRANSGTPDPALHATIRASAHRAAQIAPDLIRATPPRAFLVHNLNFPMTCDATTAIQRTIPARVVLPRLFSPAADDGTHRLVFRQGEDLSPATPLTDRAAIAAGHISHTILNYTQLGEAPPLC